MQTQANQVPEQPIASGGQSAPGKISKAEKRVQAMRLLLEGKSVDEIAQFLELAPRAIQKWQREWKKLGGTDLTDSLHKVISQHETELSQYQTALEAAHEHADQMQKRIETLEAEILYRMHLVEEMREELAAADAHTRILVFKEMADSISRPLRLLLALSEADLIADDRQKWRWMIRLSSYLRGEVGLSLVGEEQVTFTLTADNCDMYTVEEQITLPCTVRIVRSGIAYKDAVLQRPLVEVVDVG